MLPAPEYTQHLNSEHAVSCSWYRLKHIEVKNEIFAILEDFLFVLKTEEERVVIKVILHKVTAKTNFVNYEVVLWL